MGKEHKFCQSCAMPLTEDVLGTNVDGSENEDYCIYCYKDGAFTSDLTMEEMVSFCAQYVNEYNKNTGRNLSQEEYKVLLRLFFPSLKRWQQQTLASLSTEETGAGMVTLSGTTSETITLPIANLLYIETVGNYLKVYQLCGDEVRSDMLRATLTQMKDDLQTYPMMARCHRAFLVNLQQVEQVVSKSGSMRLLIKHCHTSIPVSRHNMAQVKTALKEYQRSYNE